MSAFASLATRPSAFRAAGAAFRAAPAAVRKALPVVRDWTASHEAIQPERRSFATLWKREKKRRGETFAEERPAVEAGPADGDEAIPDRPDGTHASPVEPAQGEAPAGARRAFASGALRPASRSDGDGDTDNPVLAAVREALAGRPRIAHPGALSVAGQTPDARGAVERFMDHFAQNGGEVVRFGSAAEASAWVGALAARFASCDVGVFVPEHLSPPTAGLRAAPAAEAALGVSSAIAAAADTGTVVLDSRDGRATQLLPPTHLVWIRESAIHETLASTLAIVGERLPAAIGLHSGPSRSADIGRVLVTGVHGPGHVIAAIVP
jgi:L-lactate dehydrogenase complex protein LldG